MSRGPTLRYSGGKLKPVVPDHLTASQAIRGKALDLGKVSAVQAERRRRLAYLEKRKRLSRKEKKELEQLRATVKPEPKKEPQRR